VRDNLSDDGGARPLGGRVNQSGFAFLRRGEMVLPFDGSEAEIVLAEQDARHEIHIHLDVIVEVHDIDHEAVTHVAAEEALRRLGRALESQRIV
jgi:hypothetical protein